MSKPSPATGVALCLGGAPPLDGEALLAALRGRSAPVRAERGLCRKRGALSAFVREHQLSKLVFGACGHAGEGPALERELRSAGLEPWDATTVRLDWWGVGAEARGALLLAAAVARREAATPVSPDNYSIRFVPPSGRVSRRALLGLAPLRPRLVPAVDVRTCTALYGCRLCLGVCPRHALFAEGNEVRLNRVLCDGCGLCVAGCPAGAVSFPGWMPQEMDATLGALLSAAPEVLPSRVVGLACPEAFERLGTALSRSDDRLPRLLPIVLPSLGMALPFLTLRSLSLGATGVILFACPDGCRSHGGQGRLRKQVTALRELLASLGLDGFLFGPVELAPDGQAVPGDVADFVSEAGSRWQRVLPPAQTEGPLGSYHLAPALVEAARRSGAGSETRVSGADLGIASLRLEDGRCSLCGLCAASCPSAALVFSESEERQELGFAASLCVGCGLCLAACPEEALRIERVVSVGELAAPEGVLKSGAVTRCLRCGRPQAGGAMVTVVARRLGDNGRVLRLLRYCPDCRMTAARPRP